MTSNTATGPKTATASVGTQNNVGSQVSAIFYRLQGFRKLICLRFFPTSGVVVE